VLRRDLCKEMQLSDWAMRPLLPQQVQYAAMDALVLCLLFDVLVVEAALCRG
jgi:ribonuclease D